MYWEFDVNKLNSCSLQLIDYPENNISCNLKMFSIYQFCLSGIALKGFETHSTCI